MKSVMALEPATAASPALVPLVHVGFALTGVMTTHSRPTASLSRSPLVPERRALRRSFSRPVHRLVPVRALSADIDPVARLPFLFRHAFSLIALGTLLLGRGPWTLGLASVFLYGSGLGLSISSTNLWIGEANPASPRRRAEPGEFHVDHRALAFPSLVALGDHLHRMSSVLDALAAIAAVLALALAASRFQTASPSSATSPMPAAPDFIVQQKP